VNVSSLVIGTWVIVSLNQRYRAYHRKFIRTYILFVVYFNIGLVNDLFIKYILTNLVIPGGKVYDLVFVYTGTSIRLFILTGLVYYFLKLTLEIRQKNLTRLFRLIFVSVVSASAVYLLSGLVVYSVNGSYEWLNLVRNGAEYCADITLLIFLSVFIVKVRDITEPGIKKALKVFGYFYLGAFIFPYSNTLFDLFILDYFVLTLLLMTNFFPLIWFKYYFKLYYTEQEHHSYVKLIIADLTEKHGLTRREREILGFIMSGQSYKEIAGDLYISYHTVKNHIYNLYQKLGINSRGELLRRLSGINGV
jgi:DNA-binding CsgD family transcriptional regulator